MFVGTERVRVVDQLVDHFDRVAKGSGPRIVVLKGSPGLGKTRCVQEFYARLAARQQPPNYWPATIYDGQGSIEETRRVTSPRAFTAERGAKLDYIWVGLRCVEESGRLLSSLLSDGMAQLAEHATAIEAAAPFGKRARRKLRAHVPKVQALVGLLAVISNPIVATAGIASTGRDIHRLVEAAQAKRAHDQLAGRDDRLGRSVDLGRAELSEGTELAQRFAHLAESDPAIPIVLFVDDAHWADPTLVTLISELHRHPSAPVLVVTTAWPSVLNRQERQLKNLTANTFGALLAVDWRPPTYDIPLRRLAADELDQLVKAVAPATPPNVSAALAGKARGNPRALELMLRLPVLQPVHRSITVTVAEIEALPGKIADLYSALWATMPQATKSALVHAAVHGPIYFPATVTTTAAAIGHTVNAPDLESARTVEQWVLALGELHEFVEPANHHVARDAIGDYLTAEQLATYRQAIADEARTNIVSGQISPALRVHSAELIDRLADVAVIDHIGIAVAHKTLGDAAAERFDSTLAVQRWRRALAAWTNAPKQDPALLSARGYLASRLLLAGRVEDAVEAYEAILVDQQEILDSIGPEAVLITRNNYASALGEAHRFDEALALHDDLVADHRQLYGEDHAETMRARNNRIVALAEAGRPLDASQQYLELIADYDRVLGPTDPATINARVNFLRLRSMHGPNDDVAADYAEALSNAYTTLGPDHRITLTLRHHHADSLGAAMGPADAVDAYEQLLPDLVRLLGPDDLETLAARSDLASWLAEAERLDEATAAGAAVLADIARVLDAGHRLTLTARLNLATFMARDSKRGNEAAAALEALIPDVMHHLGPDDELTLQAHRALQMVHADP